MSKMHPDAAEPLRRQAETQRAQSPATLPPENRKSLQEMAHELAVYQLKFCKFEICSRYAARSANPHEVLPERFWPRI